MTAVFHRLCRVGDLLISILLMGDRRGIGGDLVGERVGLVFGDFFRIPGGLAFFLIGDIGGDFLEVPAVGCCFRQGRQFLNSWSSEFCLENYIKKT